MKHGKPVYEKHPGAPDDYYESFVKAGEIALVPRDLAEKLAPSSGLRNRLVHEYDLLDHKIVLEAVGTAVDLYPQYVMHETGIVTVTC